ncbi:hypothetical protein [Streptomyces mangrovisoli]|uniref:hypothetical protein n=1 Tax=Streptomyces mangrovisoli TaxID=1428628 RepID=UPI000621EAF2|nr:hypothetical protein [Streptomyces mangrovisoli]
MTDAFGARTELDRARTEADAAQAHADEQLAVVRRLQDATRAGDERATPDLLAAAEAAQAEAQRTADGLDALVGGAADTLAQALGEGTPLFPDGNTDPIALLPVRVETIWWEPSTLRVRVYPDDILLSRFDPALSPAEAEAGTGYWRAPGPEAWQRVQDRLRPERASWAVAACRPGAAPPVIAADPGGRRQRTAALPKRWRFVGLVAGQVVVDKPGRPVPDPLPVGLLRADEEGWETDWFEAVKAGMAVELILPEGVDHLDELLVVGVRADSAADGAARLRDLLHGHRYGGGLGLLPAGTATNNTPRARSGWSSAPGYPGPDPDPEAGARPVADALAGALGLPDAGFLRGCPGAADAEPAAVAALTLLTWPTLGKGFAEAAVSELDLGTRQVTATGSARPWRAVRDHLAEHVRSRGPLPMLRVGRQPYGVLPVTSLGDWRPRRPEDVDALLAPWLLRLRDRWRAAVAAADLIPRVRPDQPVDQVAVDALQRLPVATGLAMRRLDGPGFAVPRTPRDQPPAEPGVPGLSPAGVLRWTTNADGWTDLGWGLDDETGVPRFVTRLAPDAVAFPARATATADYFAAVRAFLAGELDAEGYDRAWPVQLSSGRDTPPRRATFFDLGTGAAGTPADTDTPAPDGGPSPDGTPAADGTPPDDTSDASDAPPPDDASPAADPGPPDATGLLDALLFLPNWAFFEGDDGTDDPLRQALAVTADVDQLVADVLEGLTGHDRAERVAAAVRATGALPRFEQALRTLAAVPVSRLPELLLEVVDVHAHRVDAWVTSLASRRLAELRSSGAGGVRYGCYGWVQELPRPAQGREQADVELDGENTTVEVSDQDGYIHAPSLQHAATAAVLRSGFLGHPGEQTYAVDLTSRRARVARWLVGGVRQGQELGSLLGYRFERALHDAELDHLVDRFRRRFPLPVVPEPQGPGADAGLWARSAEAVAARNVVDGMALVRAGSGASALPSDVDGAPVVPDADRDAVAPLLDDLADALDAVGDLVLAESVHQLVGGNPVRAGLTADTLGRGENVPDDFHVLRTPRRARALTHRIAALLPSAPGAPTGWPTDPLATLQPALETWTAHLLGPAAAWTITGVLSVPSKEGDGDAPEGAGDPAGAGPADGGDGPAGGGGPTGEARGVTGGGAGSSDGSAATPGSPAVGGTAEADGGPTGGGASGGGADRGGGAEPGDVGGGVPGGAGGGRAFEVRIDRLGLGALTSVLDAGGEQARLRGAVLAVLGAPAGAQVTFGGPGWSGLCGRAARIRSLLATAQPLLPVHMAGQPTGTAGPPDPSADLGELRARLARFAADPQVSPHPAAPDLAELAAEPPAAGPVESWLSRARAALGEVLGADVPLLPSLTTVPDGRGEVSGADLEDWLRRNAAVRPLVRALHESLLLAGARGGRTEPLRAAQAPAAAADCWIGGPFPGGQRPAATVHVVWHAPVDLAPGAGAAGLLLDEWIELLPGSDPPPPPAAGPSQPENAATPPQPATAGGVPQPGTPPEGPPQQSELTGVAFHYDRPDAKAPHSVLIAVPPDTDRGWTSDGLVQVLRETLESAKLRAVDIADLPGMNQLLPAIQIPAHGGTGQALAAIETRRPNTDPDGPFRLEPGHRTDDIEAGLAARVHDPLWLLTRQWQFGEFTAQDAGSPAVVRMSGSSAPIDAWRPVGAADWVPYDPRLGPLDVQIEDEPVRADERLRAEGGAALLRMADDAGVLAAAVTALTAHQLADGTPDMSLVGLLEGRVPDAAAVAAALDAGTLGGAADPAFAEVTGRWRRWWAGQLAGAGPDCYAPQRLEYAAELSTGGTVLRADQYLGDGLDWYALDVHTGDEVVAAPAAAPRSFSGESVPTTVRYGGLPADRFWEMEDARVDLGATEVSTLDTGRLLLISFATVYGNDWFLAPLEVPAGSLTTLDQLLVRDVFGRQHLVRRAGLDDPSWSMFTLHAPEADHPAASALVVLPTEPGQAGEPLEEVVLARDELANLAWAVRHRCTDGRGVPTDLRDRWARVAPPDPAPAGNLPGYAVRTTVPDYWLPLVPEPVLREGTLSTRFKAVPQDEPGTEPPPPGRLIVPGVRIHEEEVPREGVRLTRRPVLARWYDGSWHSWVRREKAPGTGGSSSGLAFDTVRPTEPWP